MKIILSLWFNFIRFLGDNRSAFYEREKRKEEESYRSNEKSSTII